MNPHDAAHVLAKALRGSADFKALKEAQEQLKDDKSALEMLLDFRKTQLELQKEQLQGVEITPEQEQKLEKLYEVINLNTAIKNFLHAEYRVAILLRDVHKVIGEATEEIYDADLMALPETENDEAGN